MPRASTARASSSSPAPATPVAAPEAQKQPRTSRSALINGYRVTVADVREMLNDGDRSPTLCPEQCIVERKGECSHGFRSLARQWRMV